MNQQDKDHSGAYWSVLCWRCLADNIGSHKSSLSVGGRVSFKTSDQLVANLHTMISELFPVWKKNTKFLDISFLWVQNLVKSVLAWIIVWRQIANKQALKPVKAYGRIYSSLARSELIEVIISYHAKLAISLHFCQNNCPYAICIMLNDTWNVYPPRVSNMILNVSTHFEYFQVFA